MELSDACFVGPPLKKQFSPRMKPFLPRDADVLKREAGTHCINNGA
jgi:hypothetical protein